jgi:hypothetical protein
MQEVLKRLRGWASKRKALSKRSSPCPVCHSNSWGVQNVLLSLHEYPGTKAVLGSGFVFPVFPVYCRTCGYTRFLSAAVLGLLPTSEEDTHGTARPETEVAAALDPGTKPPTSGANPAGSAPGKEGDNG